MWREFISQVTPDCEFRPPASHPDIDSLAQALNVTLPPDLMALLRETNGVYDKRSYLEFIWSCDEIQNENLKLRTGKIFLETYKPLDSLLFFGRTGSDGILFAFPISAQGVAHVRDIIAWVPIPDTRDTVASSLADFIRRWLRGTLNII